jgi:hypothetical protein
VRKIVDIYEILDRVLGDITEILSRCDSAGFTIIVDMASKRKTRRATDETSESAPVVPDWQHERPRSKRKKASGPRFNPVNAAEGDSVAPSSPENYI